MTMTQTRVPSSNSSKRNHMLRLLAASALGGLLLGLVIGCGAGRPSAPLSPPPTSATVRPDAARAASAEEQRAFTDADALRAAGREDASLEAFRRFVQRYPSSDLTSRALMTLGALSLKAAQPAQARGYYEHVTQRFATSPLAPEAHLQLGVIAHDAQRYEDSITSLSFALRGLTQPQQRAQAHYYTGLNLRQLQRLADAFEAFDRTVKTRPDDALIQEAQDAMRFLMEQQLTPDDLRRLAQLHAEEPLGAQLLLRLAQRHRETGDIRGEQDALQQLVNQYPHDPQQPEAMARLEALEASWNTDASKLGVLLPLSGEGKLVGQRVLWGIELALGEWRAEQPGRHIQLQVRDTQGDSATAREALRSLVMDDHVIAVIGPLFSEVATALAPLTEELGVPVISPYARDSRFPALSSYAFRNCLTDANQARFLADYAVRHLNLTQFAVLYPDDPYGQSLKDTFIEHATQLEGQVVAVSAYPPNDRNFGRSIKRLGGIDDESLDDILAGAATRATMTASKPYEAIFLPGYYDRVGLIAPELAFYNIRNVQLLGTDGWNSRELIAIGERFVENAIFVDGFFADAKAPAVEAFVSQFLSRYEEQPTLVAAQGYDTMRMLAQLLQTGVATRFDLRERLLQVRDFPGVSGLTSMDQDGDAIKVPYLLSVKNGRIIQLN